MLKRNEKGELVDNPQVDDKTGNVYGRLTVLGVDLEKASRKTHWLCACECGNSVSIRADSLGRTNSCGCLKKEADYHNLRLDEKQMHGLTNHPAYPRWRAMMSRCYHPKNSHYKYYGGRGIEVCEEWHTVKNFIAWAENNGFKPELTLERLDVDQDYKPENCTWVPWEVQYYNKTTTVWHEYKGEKKTTMQWVHELNIPLARAWSYKQKNEDFTDIIEEYKNKTTPR